MSFGPKVSLGTLCLPQESMVGRLRRQRYISRKTVLKVLKVVAHGLALAAGGSTQVCSVSIVCARSPAPVPARAMILLRGDGGGTDAGAGGSERAVSSLIVARPSELEGLL
jgi:hypothetical protein